EDGIRDRNVTGVQTCALPISECTEAEQPLESAHEGTPNERTEESTSSEPAGESAVVPSSVPTTDSPQPTAVAAILTAPTVSATEIGRASCREIGRVVGAAGRG